MNASSFFSQVSDELSWSRLIPSATVGLLSGIMQVMLAISFAALIFRGQLSPHLLDGIGFALMSALLGGGAVALLTSAPGVVSGNQNVPSAIMALAALSVASAIPAGAPDRQLFVTVVVLIGVTTALTGLFFYVLGRYGLGNLVRFLPYPVVGGFLAGTGWLLVVGGFEIMVDLTPSRATLPLLLQPELLPRWLPGLLFACLLVLILRRIRHAFTLPAAILGTVLAFYAIMVARGVPLATLTADGWLLGPYPQQTLWQPISFSDLALVHWPAVLGQAANIATIIMMSAISLLLNGSALELALGEDLDLDRELRAAGIGNLLASAAGGLVSFQQISLSVLVIKVGKAGRLAGLIAVVVCALILFVGAPVLSLFPKLVLGGLVVYLGLAFLLDTLQKDWGILPRSDYLVIVLILLVTAFVGFMEAVGVGLLVAVILFVIKYSRIDIIRNELTGRTAQSRVTRSPEKNRLLRETGEQLLAFRLQGFIFFGTADGLFERIRARVNESVPSLRRYILLDFAHVTGIDSTALVCFEKLLSLLPQRDMTLLLTEPTPELKRHLDQLTEHNCEIHIFPDLDRGLEWCEERRLDAVLDRAGERQLSAILAARIGDANTAGRLLSYFQRQEAPAGFTLMRQGAAPDKLYLIESGKISAYLREQDGRAVRLQTMQDWNVLGEIGFILNTERTADVEVEAPGVVYCLTREALQTMQREEPQLAAAFHQLILTLLAERVVHLVSVVDALRR